MTTTDLLPAVLALPTEERARFARELIRSLEDELDDPVLVERAWAEEIGRRVDEIVDGSVDTVAWETVRDEIRDDLARRQGR